MKDFFHPFTSSGEFGRTNLISLFDAERDTPELLDAVAAKVPEIRDIMGSLRQSVPLVPHSGVGPVGTGRFYRLPNHYRSGG